MSDISNTNSNMAFRKVHSGGVEAFLTQYIVDGTRNLPVCLTMIGPKNAVRSLLMQANEESRQGDSDSVAFHITDPDPTVGSVGFRLPNANYRTLSKDLALPPDVMRLKGRSSTVYEGRIMSFLMTKEAGNNELYVPVSGQILMIGDREQINEEWQKYLRYAQTPNGAQWAEYKPPVWAPDLFNVFQYLVQRVRVPIHPYWMPWIFSEVGDRVRSDYWLEGHGHVTFMSYVHGYVHPLAKGTCEGGVYRLQTDNIREEWKALLMKNPYRAEGIKFRAVVPAEIQEQQKQEEIADLDKCPVCGSRLVQAWCHKCEAYTGRPGYEVPQAPQSVQTDFAAKVSSICPVCTKPLVDGKCDNKACDNYGLVPEDSAEEWDLDSLISDDHSHSDIRDDSLHDLLHSTEWTEISPATFAEALIRGVIRLNDLVEFTDGVSIEVGEDDKRYHLRQSLLSNIPGFISAKDAANLIGALTYYLNVQAHIDVVDDEVEAIQRTKAEDATPTPWDEIGINKVRKQFLIEQMQVTPWEELDPVTFAEALVYSVITLDELKNYRHRMAFEFHERPEDTARADSWLEDMPQMITDADVSRLANEIENYLQWMEFTEAETPDVENGDKLRITELHMKFSDPATWDEMTPQELADCLRLGVISPAEFQDWQRETDQPEPPVETSVQTEEMPLDQKIEQAYIENEEATERYKDALRKELADSPLSEMETADLAYAMHLGLIMPREFREKMNAGEISREKYNEVCGMFLDFDAGYAPEPTETWKLTHKPAETPKPTPPAATPKPPKQDSFSGFLGSLLKGYNSIKGDIKKPADDDDTSDTNSHSDDLN